MLVLLDGSQNKCILILEVTHMENIYNIVGTFEFYEMSNYIWILYGVFLLIYATNRSNLNLFKTTLFGWGLLYGTYLGGIASIGILPVCLVVIIFWIIVEIIMSRKREFFSMMGVFIFLTRFVYRIMLYVNHSMEMKRIFSLLSVVLAMLCTLILHQSKRYYKSIQKELFYGYIFILLTTDYIVSGLCEIIWKQSEGAWKFFYEKNAVYEYFVYMSKIEIRELYILIFYFVAFLVIYSIGVKLLKFRLRETK